MFTTQDYNDLTRSEFYALLIQQARAMLRDESDFIANMSNLASLLFTALNEVNWVGFYRLLSPEELVLGPFMGNPACTRLKVGKGVCGTSVALRRSVIVPNVHKFEGHVACDSASNSEIVIPIFKGSKILGVLDIDSPKFDRFDEKDREALEEIVRLLVEFSHC